MRIPIRPDHKPLGDSRAIALKRFLCLENRLQANAALREKYVEFMREYERLGHMRLATAPPGRDEMVYYIPHHCVLDKFRVVFDASCQTTSGESFNDIQIVGEKLQGDLADTLVRFRCKKYALVGDVEKMFRQVEIVPEQWNCQRIFWRENPNQPLREYCLTVITYGMSSSVHGSVRAMIQCANDHETEWPRAAKAVREDFYVDDCFTGADVEQEAAQLCSDLGALLNKGGFRLTKWASNSKLVLQAVQGADDIRELSEDDGTKVLGLRWITSTDELSFRVMRQNMVENPTRRLVLSEIAKLYDPNGFLGPIVIRAKLMMRDICRLGVKWDDPIPAEMQAQWSSFHNSLERLSEVRLPRWICTTAGSSVQLHGFADASLKAYAAVIYVRTVSAKGEVACRLLLSKTRVAPTWACTVPRLELEAAKLLAQLMQHTREIAEFKDAEYYCWSDSMVTLHWINKSSADLKLYVANRVAAIQTATNVNVWAHVKTGDNPADPASRGMGMEEFLQSSLWFHGPAWLMLPQEQWPKPRFSLDAATKEQAEVEYKNVNHAVVLSAVKLDNLTLLERFSNWDKIVRITAYALQFWERCKNPLKIPRPNDKLSAQGIASFMANGAMLGQEELDRAMVFWVQYAQRQHFRKEIKCRQNGNPFPGDSKITGMNPKMNPDGVLCVGGRLNNAGLPSEQQNQMIIPARSRLCWLLMDKAHRATLHGGVQDMMRYLRTKFWVPCMRAELSYFFSQCGRCKRYSGGPAGQLMGDLPADRVRQARPFYKTGVDYAGPYEVRVRPGRPSTRGQQAAATHTKGYVAVFVCMVTRAVHLEAVSSMTTEAFIAAFTRFVARRGHCAHMYSDNGTNFVGANNEMSEALEIWKRQQTLELVQARGTTWHFITPAAPFQGGIWESAVKSMKRHLRPTLGTRKFTFEGLSTLLAQTEAVLNSRPLCAMSDDINDCRALTPAHFLIGEELVMPIPVRHADASGGLSSVYRQLQSDADDFWHRWRADYLNTLQQRRKWKVETANMQVGDLVLLSHETASRTHWPMGRVTKVYPGKDGLVRSVSVRIDGTEYERPIRKLCPLPMEDPFEIWT